MLAFLNHVLDFLQMQKLDMVIDIVKIKQFKQKHVA